MSNYTIETNKTNYSEKNEDQIEICLGKSLDFSELENQVRFNQYCRFSKNDYIPTCILYQIVSEYGDEEDVGRVNFTFQYSCWKKKYTTKTKSNCVI